MAAQNVHEFGSPQPILSMTDTEKKFIADHEAGHAVAAVLLRKKMNVEIATIIRRGGALGLVGSKPAFDSYTTSKNDLLQDLDVCIASRAVEELKHNMNMTGFSGDLQHATQIVVHMVSSVAMGSDMLSYAALGMNTSGPVLAQARKLTLVRYRLVKEFIKRNMKAVNAISDAMLASGDVDGPEVIRIVTENAEFVPEGELHEALAELLSEEELMRFRSEFSEPLAAIDYKKPDDKDGKDDKATASAKE
jgi:cell division protease FtsH